MSLAYCGTGLSLSFSGLPIGPIVVPCWGSYLESYKIIPKRNYYGAYGYTDSDFLKSRKSNSANVNNIRRNSLPTSPNPVAVARCLWPVLEGPVLEVVEVVNPKR